MQVPLLICSLTGSSEVWFLKASTHRNLCGRDRLSPGSVFPNCLASHNMTRLTLFRKRSISVGATFRFYPNDSVLFEEPDLFDLCAVTVGVCFCPPPSKSMTVSGSLWTLVIIKSCLNKSQFICLLAIVFKSLQALISSRVHAETVQWR